MERKQTNHPILSVVFLLWMIGVVSVGCTGQSIVPPTTQSGYVGALTTDYDNALDVPMQLALGTIKLEDTPNAVSAEQAAVLLPLWRSLQSNSLKSDAERNTVFKQIEKTMTEAQLAAIRAMRLTQNDLVDIAPGGDAFPQGLRSEGLPRSDDGTPRSPGGQRLSGGQGFDSAMMATRRAQMENMSEQERPQMLPRFQNGNVAIGSDMTLNVVIARVVRLLAERSGQEMPLPPTVPISPDDKPTATTETTPVPTATPPPITTMVALTATPTPTATPTATESASTPTAVTTQSPATAPRPTATVQVNATPLPGLTQIPDPNPGPPLTVLVSMNQVEQDPLVETAKIYKVGGLVHNNGTETYVLSTVHVTFYDAEGFRGSYVKFPGRNTGGEWVWQGATEADFACLLLAPGEACPFIVEIRAQNMASFMIHPDATATDREPVNVQLSDVRVIQDNTNFVRFTGKATNIGTVKAKNITVIGMLLDANGQIVSIGSTVVVQEDIAPGAAVNFDLRIAKTSYATYRLVGQAERDWQ